MIDNVLTDLIDSILCRKECFNACTTNKFFPISLVDLIRQCIKLFLQLCLIQVHVDRNGAEVQLQCSTIRHRVLEGIFGNVTVLIFFRPEGRKCIVIIPVDWSSCQSEEESVGQGGAHLLAKVTFLSAMGLIHQKDNVVASINDLAIIQIPKLEDGCDQNLSLAYLGLKFLFRHDVPSRPW